MRISDAAVNPTNLTAHLAALVAKSMAMVGLARQAQNPVVAGGIDINALSVPANALERGAAHRRNQISAQEAQRSSTVYLGTGKCARTR